MRAAWLLSLILLLGTACGLVQQTPITLPSGEVPVHVGVEPNLVTLMPDSVWTGTRYLLFDGPEQGFTLVGGPGSMESRPAPLDAGAVDRVADGNFADTTFLPMQVNCGPDDWTPDRHWLGCGELFEVELAPGLYPILAGDPQPGEPPAMSVLEVTP